MSRARTSAVREGGQRGRVAAVVLAAGASRRFGSNKLLAPWKGRSLISRAVGVVARVPLQEVVVVLGRDAELVQADLERNADRHPNLRCVINAEYAAGMSTSLRTGIAALAPTSDAVLVVLGDEPETPTAAFQRVIDAHRRTRAPIVRAVYEGGVPGRPVLFARSMFVELLAIEGDQGARALISAHREHVRDVRVTGPAPGDVDTAEDYARLLGSPAGACRPAR